MALLKTWKPLKTLFKNPYYKKVIKDINRNRKIKDIYPRKQDVFRAFKVREEDLKVIILGQDPYHTPEVANGLAFSSSLGIPPSLRNIFKELEIEYRTPIMHKALENPELFWGNNLVEQGVLLLNTALTVEKGKPLSHKDLWKPITSTLIKYLKKDFPDVVWLLLGNKAKEMAEDVTYRVSTTHPSPLSAHRGFIGSNCFSQVNNLLSKLSKQEIQWIPNNNF